MTHKPNIRRSIAITVAMRWSDRLIAFVSTIALARILVPEDFGIIAQAYIVIALIDTVMDLGVSLALIQNRDATPDHYNTAWTMRLAQAIAAALVVFAVAPIAGDYFREPRVVEVIRILGAGMVLAAAENIWVVSFQKDMKFGRDFQLAFLKRLSGFVVTLVLALAWQSYWALVVGTLIGKAVGVVLSYRMHPMRPHLSIARLGELFAFSQWAMARAIGNFLNAELHRLLVGGRSNTGTMGAYTLANEISTTPSNEILAPLYRALFPALVQAKQNPDELKRIYLLAQGLQVALVIPASIGLSLVAAEVVALLLGPKWTSVVPFLQVLALVEVGNAFLTGSGYILITVGRIKHCAAIAWVPVLSFATAALLIFPGTDAIHLAWLRVASTGIGVCVALWMLRGALPGLRIAEIIANVWRPIVSTALMAALIASMGPLAEVGILLAALFKIAAGAMTYLFAGLLLWVLSGRPAGAEVYLMELFAAFWERRWWATSGKRR